jgi:hypothetical protein
VVIDRLLKSGQKEIDLTATISMEHAGILVTDPMFDDWMDKLAEIRRSANEIDVGEDNCRLAN